MSGPTRYISILLKCRVKKDLFYFIERDYRYRVVSLAVCLTTPRGRYSQSKDTARYTSLGAAIDTVHIKYSGRLRHMQRAECSIYISIVQIPTYLAVIILCTQHLFS